MDNRINTEIHFENIEKNEPVNGGSCSVHGCNEWSIHFANIILNNVKIFVPVCSNHASKLEDELYLQKIENPNADGLCMESDCGKTPTKRALLDVRGLTLSIDACQHDAREIGHVLVKDGELVRVPTFKCLPRNDLVGGMKFWCPYCCQWHLHGAREGHRTAHCRKEDSPLKRTGYYLEILSHEEIFAEKPE